MDIFNSKAAKDCLWRVAFLKYPDSMPAGLLGFADILRAANMLANQRVFETEIVDLDTLRDTPPMAYDIIVVPGFWAYSPSDISKFIEGQRRLIHTLATLPPQQTIWGYCTGVCLLAHAGRLEAEPATLTWWAVSAMRRKFPDIDWHPDRMLIFGARAATASGVMGHVPLALALIEAVMNADKAREISRLMVLPRPRLIHPAFKSVHLLQQGTPFLRRFHQTVTRLPATEVTAERLASALGFSERTLSRHVQADAGTTLAKLARSIKLAQVAERLSETSQAPSEICSELGFSSESNMRRMFKAETNLTLSEYRMSF